MPIRSVPLALLFSAFAAGAQAQPPAGRWTEARASGWYEKQPWLVGSNYIPATAINELEMWQAETFDPATIDKELGWAEGLGMTTMRVFLHDLPWQQDAAGYRGRIERFLVIAERHHIKPLLRAVRLVLGSRSAPRAAARAHAGRAQLRVGAGARAPRRSRIRPRHAASA